MVTVVVLVLLSLTRNDWMLLSVFALDESASSKALLHWFA